MHSSMAFVNGAGVRPEGLTVEVVDLTVMRTLLTSVGSSSNHEQPALDKSKSKDEHQAEEESQAETASKPEGYANDPDDPTNPNEVRERHLKKLKP